MTLKSIFAILLLCGSLAAQMDTTVHNLPDAPSQTQKRIFDWSFITGHAIYGASVAFDDYVTARNVGTCAFEGNSDLGRLPSSKAIAIHGAVEFTAVVAVDAAFKWFGRQQGVPHWLNKTGGNIGAIIGTSKHVHGGYQWITLCY